jgi:hypothetical protein
MVAVVAHVTALGRGSGAGVDSDAGFVFEVRGELITRFISHSDPAVALATVGRSE